MTTTTVRTVRKDGGFTIVHNEIFEHGLSHKAVGVLVYMLSRPNDWQFAAARIAKVFGVGRDGILAAMRELTDVGYIRAVTIGGAEPRTEWWLRDSLNVDWPDGSRDGKPDSGESDSGEPDSIPRTDEPRTDEPTDSLRSSDDPSSSSNSRQETDDPVKLEIQDTARAYWDWHKDARGCEPAIDWLPLRGVIIACLKRGLTADEILEAMKRIDRVKPTTAGVIAEHAKMRDAEERRAGPAITPGALRVWSGLGHWARSRDVALESVTDRPAMLTAINALLSPGFGKSECEVAVRCALCWKHGGFRTLTVDELIDRSMPIEQPFNERPIADAVAMAYRAGGYR